MEVPQTPGDFSKSFETQNLPQVSGIVPPGHGVTPKIPTLFFGIFFFFFPPKKVFPAVFQLLKAILNKPAKGWERVFSMKKKSCPILGCVPGWGLEQPLEAGIGWILRFFPPKPVWDPLEQRADFQLEQLCYKNIGKGRCTPCCSCREFSRSICSREIPKEKALPIHEENQTQPLDSAWTIPCFFQIPSHSRGFPVCIVQVFPIHPERSVRVNGKKNFPPGKTSPAQFFFFREFFCIGEKNVPAPPGLCESGWELWNLIPQKRRIRVGIPKLSCQAVNRGDSLSAEGILVPFLRNSRSVCNRELPAPAGKVGRAGKGAGNSSRPLQ